MKNLVFSQLICEIQVPAGRTSYQLYLWFLGILFCSEPGIHVKGFVSVPHFLAVSVWGPFAVGAFAGEPHLPAIPPAPFVLPQRIASRLCCDALHLFGYLMYTFVLLFPVRYSSFLNICWLILMLHGQQIERLFHRLIPFPVACNSCTELRAGRSVCVFHVGGRDLGTGAIICCLPGCLLWDNGLILLLGTPAVQAGALC